MWLAIIATTDIARNDNAGAVEKLGVAGERRKNASFEISRPGGLAGTICAGSSRARGYQAPSFQSSNFATSLLALLIREMNTGQNTMILFRGSHSPIPKPNFGASEAQVKQEKHPNRPGFPAWLRLPTKKRFLVPLNTRNRACLISL